MIFTTFQLAEIKLKMSINQQQLIDELKELKIKNKELSDKAEKISNSNKCLSIKYKTMKKKLRKAVYYIKKVWHHSCHHLKTYFFLLKNLSNRMADYLDCKLTSQIVITEKFQVKDYN